MRKTTTDPHIADHLEWIGFIRPTGLVVSAAAMVRAGAILERRDSEGQRLLLECAREQTVDPKRGPELVLPDFEAFARTVLGWSFSPKGYAGTEASPITDSLEAAIPDAGETLRPDFAVREREPKENAAPWQLLVNVYDPREDFDQIAAGGGRLELSPHGRMERLLRTTRVSAGLLFNGRSIRLISAPHGESSGWLDFRVSEMSATAGRPICAAMRLLLNERRLLSLPKSARFAALLEDSRKYQNEVSEHLAEQVLHALYELIRGFQAAHDASRGALLKDVLDQEPDRVYRALLTVLLRTVFLLYAEERDMLPGDETFVRHYSLGGLHERLREDAALFPDTMDQRYGAWAQLLVLFRMVYDGAAYGDIVLPKRHGDLFDPERFPFLEGRQGPRAAGERIDVPHVSDGAVYRALEKLLVLDGERLSYRALDVEQIGSVYETMMGFRVEIATGQSVAIRAEKKHGAPTTIDLEALLRAPGANRDKWLLENAGRKIPDGVKKAVKEASDLTDLHAALDKVIDKRATPDKVARGSLILQPSEERRRSGSHYTPRSLTEPIVRTTLEPILSRLKAADGTAPKPSQILDLKVCDPAMGSGAFLVEACRQLADSLIESWRVHGGMPEVPKDEDEVIFARRLIAQRCLYGVDKNPMAVDLAKVSLWLVTLAKDHAFTFLDHSLRNGDSLVGLTNEQILAVHWDTAAPKSLFDDTLPDRIKQSADIRSKIATADEVEYDALHDQFESSNGYIRDVRLIGDAVIAAYFAADKPKARLAKRAEVMEDVKSLLAKSTFEDQAPYRERLNVWTDTLTTEPHPLPPFHWQLEFPEVFLRVNGGFDAMVGNPPFAGKNTIAAGNRDAYTDWLQTLHVESHGNADLVAHFFRRAFNLLNTNGTFGLIATNTIGQGDTRSTGLRWICTHGGEIYNARKRVKWPGLAAVVVSVVNIIKGRYQGAKYIGSMPVRQITAFLFHRGGNEDASNLSSNRGLSFIGNYVNGAGFTFDDSNDAASPVSLMRALILNNERNGDRIFPYLGGEEVLNHPKHQHNRYVINFGEMSEDEARMWPDLMRIVEEKVKPSRIDQLDRASREQWWLFARRGGALSKATHSCKRVMFHPNLSAHLAFAFVPVEIVVGAPHNVFAFDDYNHFSILQSRMHEIWARFFASSMKDDLRYTPSDCFETFPFPNNWQWNSTLEDSGKEYYEFRAALMIRNNEGLTKTYNRFHDPEEHDADIVKLRELHDKMDRAVLAAYGWQDISTKCDFFLDYEDEDEGKRKKKKPWRYRWPDEVRDDVLALLLELNAERAAEERAGLGGKVKGKKLSGVGSAEIGGLFE